MRSEDLLYNMAVATMMKKAERRIPYAPWASGGSALPAAIEDAVTNIPKGSGPWAAGRPPAEFASTQAAAGKLAPQAGRAGRAGAMLGSAGRGLAAGTGKFVGGLSNFLRSGSTVPIGALASGAGALSADSPVEPGEQMRGWEYSTRAGQTDSGGPGSFLGDVARGAASGAGVDLFADIWGER